MSRKTRQIRRAMVQMVEGMELLQAKLELFKAAANDVSNALLRRVRTCPRKPPEAPLMVPCECEWCRRDVIMLQAIADAGLEIVARERAYQEKWAVAGDQGVRTH